MCFTESEFACFLFVGVFISDDRAKEKAEQNNQAPVSVQAIISVSFEVYVCVYSVCMRVGSLWWCNMWCGRSEKHFSSI